MFSLFSLGYIKVIKVIKGGCNSECLNKNFIILFSVANRQVGVQLRTAYIPVKRTATATGQGSREQITQSLCTIALIL